MSRSSTRVPLSLATPQGPLPMRLYDHAHRSIAHGYGHLEKKVEPGLYRLVVDAGPVREERLLAVGGNGLTDTGIRIDVPTAAPVPGSGTADDAHVEAAMRLSHEPMQARDTGGRLVILVRNVSPGPRGPVMVSDLSLLNARHETIATAGNDFHAEPAQGWAGFSADVRPGGYLLRRTRAGPDESLSIDQSLWVEPGWTTLVFVPFRDEMGRSEPEFASVHMARIDSGFQPRDDGAMFALEVALSGLRQGRALVPPHLERLLLEEKFQNPMLGIVGALSLLEGVPVNWGLFDIVRRNLRNLAPSHPDVHGLHILGKLARGMDSDSRVPALGWPPMLRACYQALIERDPAESRRIIGAGSMADLAAARLLAQGSWTHWRAIRASDTGLATAQLRQRRLEQSIGRMRVRFGRPLEDIMARVSAAHEYAAAESSRTGAPRPGRRLERSPLASIDPDAAGFDVLAQLEAGTAGIQEAERIMDTVGLLEFDRIEIPDPASRSKGLRRISEQAGLTDSAVRRGLRTMLEIGQQGIRGTGGETG